MTSINTKHLFQSTLLHRLHINQFVGKMWYYGCTINKVKITIFFQHLIFCIAFIESSPSSTEYFTVSVVDSQSFFECYFFLSFYRVRNLLSGIIGISHAHNRFLHKYLPHCTHTWKTRECQYRIVRIETENILNIGISMRNSRKSV